MSLKDAYKVDDAIFSRVNSVVVQEFHDTSRVMVDQKGIGGITYDLVAKQLYWERGNVKIVEVTDGCLYKTDVPHCMKDPQIPRILIAKFLESLECFFSKTRISGKNLIICEKKKNIKVQHPECPAFNADLLYPALKIECEYDRDCILRWQEGKIVSIAVMDLLGPKI